LAGARHGYDVPTSESLEGEPVKTILILIVVVLVVLFLLGKFRSGKKL
jgi:hypothetical protein